MITRTHAIRAIPLWLLREYLVDLGGQVQPDGHVVGDGWWVRLTRLADFQLGSLRVGEVRMEMTGTAETLDQLERAMWPKLLRGGG